MALFPLLGTYLAAEIIAPFLAGFLILNAVLLLTQLVPLLDVILNFGIGATDFVRLVAYLCPKLMLFSLPMAAMVAIVIAFSRLANEGEFMALKACGVSSWRLVPPVLLIAAAVAASTAMVTVTLMPASDIATKKLLFRLAKEKFNKGLAEKTFSEGTGNFILYVDTIDRDDDTWHGVFIADVSKQQHPVTMVAENGKFAADSSNLTLNLALQNGSIHRSENDLSQTVLFKRYRLTIPIDTPKIIAGEDTSTVGKHGMNLDGLTEAALRAGTTTDNGRTLLLEYHKRLALPVGSFLLCLLALPLGLLAKPGRQTFGLPLGIGFFLVYFVLFSAARAMVDSFSLSPGLAVWSTNLVFGVITGMSLWLHNGDKLDQITDSFDSFSSRLRCLLTSRHHPRKMS